MKIDFKTMEIELSDFRRINIGLKRCHICKGLMFPFQQIATNKAFYDLKPCHVNCYFPDAQMRRWKKHVVGD